MSAKDMFKLEGREKEDGGLALRPRSIKGLA
jgi:hypothetical protein